MTGSAQELKELVSRFEGTPVTVVGDVFLDHYVWGKVSRISPEAPVVVVNVTSEDRRLGGAGNVARNLASLGAKVYVCGVVGDDDAGRQLIGLVEKMGANTDGMIIDRTRSTIVKSRVIAHSQQVVRIDHEVLKPLASTYAQSIATALRSSIEQTKGVVVSDYGKSTICEEVYKPIQEGFSKGRLGLNKLPVLIDPKSPNFPLYTHATVIKPNRAEAAEASGVAINDRASAAHAARVLLDRWKCELVLVTLGEQGMVLVSSKDEKVPAVEVDTDAQEVFDVSGAGDTVSAVFLLALSVGADPKQAAVLANLAAGVVVAEVGTVAIRPEELLARIESGASR